MVDVRAGKEPLELFRRFQPAFVGSMVMNFDLQLEALLAGGIEGTRQREAAAWGSLCDLGASGIVLFGAGNLGQRTLAGLRVVGIEPLWKRGSSENWLR